MSLHSAGLSNLFQFDRQAGELAVLLLLVALATLAVTMPAPGAVDNSPSDVPGVSGDGSTAEAQAGASWAIAEVLFAGLLVGLLYLARLLPEWLRTTGRRAAAIGLLLTLGAYGLALGAYQLMLVLVVGGYVGYRVTDHYGLYWLVNNALCLGVAVLGGVAIGAMFGVVGMAIALVLLSVYDHYFANERSWMFDLGKKMVEARAPVVFLRPSTWRFQWSRVVGEMDISDGRERDGDAPLTWGLGMADLALASGFIAALVTSGSFLGVDHGVGVIGAVLLGLVAAAARLSLELETRGSGAGMPPITAGMLVPYVTVLALSTFSNSIGTIEVVL